MSNNILDIKTPAQAQAAALKSDYGLENLGLTNLNQVYWNLGTEALYEEAVFRREGKIAKEGPMLVSTGKHTGRSANDKFVVREPSTESDIWWGQYNRPFSPGKFDELFHRLQGYLQGRDLFVQDVYIGADPEFRMPVRIITELAWHSLFARNMFIVPETNEEARRMTPEFTVIAVPGFQALQQIDQTNSPTFIVLNFASRVGVIGNTQYGGEIKKTVFTVMNYLLPKQGVMSMHCSANIGKEGDSALFFGLSGTGKTICFSHTREGVGDGDAGRGSLRVVPQVPARWAGVAHILHAV